MLIEGLDAGAWQPTLLLDEGAGRRAPGGTRGGTGRERAAGRADAARPRRRPACDRAGPHAAYRAPGDLPRAPELAAGGEVGAGGGGPGAHSLDRDRPADPRVPARALLLLAAARPGARGRPLHRGLARRGGGADEPLPLAGSQDRGRLQRGAARPLRRHRRQRACARRSAAASCRWSSPVPASTSRRATTSCYAPPRSCPASTSPSPGKGPNGSGWKRWRGSWVSPAGSPSSAAASDIPALLAACDVFALPSLYEGSSLAVLEAMAARRAVVSSAIGGTDELIEDGASGLLVPPGECRGTAGGAAPAARRRGAACRLRPPGPRAGRARLHAGGDDPDKRTHLPGAARRWPRPAA